MVDERRNLLNRAQTLSRQGKRLTFVIVVGSLAFLSYLTFRFSAGETDLTQASFFLNLSAGFLGALFSFIIFEYHHYMSRNWNSAERIAITGEQLLTVEEKLRAAQRIALEKFQVMRRLDRSAELAGETTKAEEIRDSIRNLRGFVLIPILEQNYLAEQAVILGRMIAQYGQDIGRQAFVKSCQTRYEQTQELQKRAFLILQKARDERTSLDELCDLLQKAIVESKHE